MLKEGTEFLIIRTPDTDIHVHNIDLSTTPEEDVVYFNDLAKDIAEIVEVIENE